MNITEELEQRGFNIGKLNTEEKQTYFSMLDTVQKTQMTPEKLRDYIASMRDAVERELINEPEFIRIFIFKFENRKQILLKARLQNYMLIEAFLTSPERAEQQLKDMVTGLIK